MDAIIKFLEGIISGVTAALDFLIGFIEDIVYVVKLTGEFVLNIPNYFAWLPAPVLATVVSIFGIVVIYKVLGQQPNQL